MDKSEFEHTQRNSESPRRRYRKMRNVLLQELAPISLAVSMEEKARKQMHVKRVLTSSYQVYVRGAFRTNWPTVELPCSPTDFAYCFIDWNT